MYRIIGFLLMIIGTLVLLVLGGLVLIWSEIINIDMPKENRVVEETPELVPTER